jgi:hypothetical protein
MATTEAGIAKEAEVPLGKYYVTEDACMECYGHGRVGNRYDYGESKCFFCNGTGYRWYAAFGAEGSGDLDEQLGDGSLRKATAAVYDDAFATGRREITIVRSDYGAGQDGRSERTVRPRYLPQKRREAERKAYEARVEAGDLMLALFSANRAAKRSRDSKMGGYFNRNTFYTLKNQALAHLLAEGRVRVAGVHRIGQVFAEVLEGGGYRFHRPCPPPENPGSAKFIGESIESKPAEAGEYDHNFAQDVVRHYLRGKAMLEVYRWPDTRTCHRCGRVGHIAIDCDEDDIDGMLDRY